MAGLVAMPPGCMACDVAHSHLHSARTRTRTSILIFELLKTPSQVWALGVSLYLLVYGKVPFAGKSLLEVYTQIQADEVQFPPEPQVR